MRRKILRRLAILTVAAPVLLASLASPAQAKGDGFVLITGPGLQEPVILTEPADVAAVFWGGGLGERDRMDRPGPRSSWGPHYEMLFVLWETETAPVTLRQYLYPFAAGGRFGMWTFTPPGQPWYHQHATAGWRVVSADAERLLRQHGLPPAGGGSFRAYGPRRLG